MTMWLIACIFLTLASSLLILAAALLSPASPTGARLNALLRGRTAAPQKSALYQRSEQWLESMGDALPRSSAELSRRRQCLIQAGLRDVKHVKIYYGARVFSALIPLAVVLLTGWFGKFPVLLFVAPALGYMLPRWLLSRRIKARQLATQLALPDALDLTIVCVEAGLSLDHALERVATELRHAHPVLSSELGLVTLEIRAGKSRAEALRNLAARTAVEDVSTLVAVVVQAERFGTSVANSLRIHANAFRTERRQRAEEQAAKTAIKMTPILVFFIFPVVFFVLLGPTIISVIRNVLPELGQ